MSETEKKLQGIIGGGNSFSSPLLFGGKGKNCR